MENLGGPPIYRPLSGSEIRLISVRPGLPDDPMRCELIYVNLDEDLEYCALSYVWGDPNHTKNIEVNDKLFPVTINLYDALCRFRCIQMEEHGWQRKQWVTAQRYVNRPLGFWGWDQDMLRRRNSEPPARSLEAAISESLLYELLWVDAICINQQDVDERSRQIPRMRDIFGLASSTVAWLGHATSPRQEMHIDVIVNAADELMSLLQLVDEGIEIEKYPVVSDHGRGFMETAYQLFEAILCRPWFRRIWIVQEVVLSKATVLMIGNRIICLDSLYLLKKIFASEKNVWALPPAFQGLLQSGLVSNIVDLMHLFGPRSSLLEGPEPTLDSFANDLYTVMMLAHQLKQATHEHDMIYGVLGMTRLPELPIDLVPNYRVPYETVFVHYFRFLIERTGDLRCLGWKKDMVPGAPTWVPDLKQITRTPKKGPRSNVVFCTDGRCMTVEGCRIGTCVKTFCYGSYGKPENFRSILNDFYDGILRPWSQLKGLPLGQVVTQWLSSSLTKRIITEYRFSLQSLETCFKIWTHKNSELLFDLVSKYLQSTEEERYIMAMKKLLVDSILGKSFFVTEDGSVGFIRSGKTIQVLNGDMVYSIKGWYIPCILRPLGGPFMFIKDCRITNKEFDGLCVDGWRGNLMESLTLI
ncbi:heterokaryon incompatibility protein-domain-containing protein [Annulohypoxylon bovei var. microspora]|nr:heterokaryon incompatibility protein-domain-containing protein [Annulohypoxylon bovei var. microspora]